MIRFFAKGRCAHCVSDDKLTKGSVGIEVRFYLEDWDAAPNRVVVFRAGSTKVDVALLTDRCTVPPEVLNNPGDMLVIGVYGTDNDSNIVIPTVYADAGRVRLGAAPSGIEPTPTTQPLIDQLLAAAEEAERVAQSVRDDADNGSFDGSDGVSPTISSASITGGHRLTIVDAGGTTTVDVMDGQDGQDGHDGQDGADGVGVPSSGAAGDVLRKASGTDFDTEWHSPEIFWAVYDSTTADEIETARIAGKAIMCAWGGKTYVMNYRQNATKFYFTAADRNSLYHISVSGSSWSNVSTKTVGTYSKPSGGIPASDLVSGISVPTGGTTGQVLKKASGTDYDTEWANESGGGGSISPYTSNPAALGTASPGSSDKYARGDHVHAKPTYSKSDVGLGNVDNVQQYSASNPPPYPVTSVNGQTGAVTISVPSSAADVGAVATTQGAANANKVLTVNSSGVVVPEDNRFVVTLTPTAQDFSGVMDKTVAEIDAAWGAGKEIWFRIYSGTDFTDVPCDRMGKTSLTYPSFNAAMLYDEMNMFVLIYTGTTSDGSKQAYSTKLYPIATGQWTGGSY